MTTELHWLDFVILFLYLAGTLWLGIWVGRKIETGLDFFLAGRQLPWWAVGLSLVATDIGGTDIIGAGGAAYTHGFAVANFEWVGCVPAMILGAFFFVPLLWRAGVTTIPEYLERRYDGRVRAAVSFCWLAFSAFNLGIMLFASAKFLEGMFGWDRGLSVVGTALIVGIYTMSGGLAAVVYTDVLQCILMIGGCFVVTFIGLDQVGGIGPLIERVRELDQSGVRAATGADHLSLVLPVDTTTPYPWTGILFGLGMILAPAYWIGNQAIIQRTLGAKSEVQASASYVWGSLVKNLIPLMIVVPGLIALVLHPDLSDGDTAYPRLAAELLPIGLRGLFLSAFLAALMSSVDSYLNSAATLFTKDFYQRFWRKDADEHQILVAGRVTTAFLMVFGVAFSFVLMRTKSGIYDIFQTLMSFFQGPAFGVLLLGLLWRRATGGAALLGFLSGVAMAVALYALDMENVKQGLGLPPLFQIRNPYLYLSVWAFLVTLFVTWTATAWSNGKRGIAGALLLLVAATMATVHWRAGGATVLHSIGESLRSLLLRIPLPLARVAFLAIPAVLVVWVLSRRAHLQIKLAAVLSLAIQFALYWIAA